MCATTQCSALSGSVADERKAGHPAGKGPLCAATDNGRTGIRPNQRNAWYPKISIARPVQRDLGVEAHLRYAQSPQAVSPSPGSSSRVMLANASLSPRHLRLNHWCSGCYKRFYNITPRDPLLQHFAYVTM